ncbi:unnamed protein product, partial [Mesorhabditis belari]|uniref:Uncharacterized protein n=1 Tax=Mesorhabditis belari TaxID=2138241 RepID=A0AAF3ENW8_9BILA
MRTFFYFSFFTAIFAQDIWYKCVKTDLDFEIRRFNLAIGINETYSYNSGDVNMVYQAVFAAFRQDIPGVCRARSAFAYYLGATYSDCMDPFTIAAIASTEITAFDAVSYGQIWNRLEFACGGGFSIAIADYPCIYSATQTSRFSACYQEFRNATNNYSDFNIFCKGVAVYAQCGETAVREMQCKNDLSAWYLCESLRYGNGKLCPGLRCFTNYL